MKKRVVEYGFDPKKIFVHPVGINAGEYPFKLREKKDGEPVNIISVGRFVEKKGFDDLLRALAIVRTRTSKAFRCFIIGDGPLKAEIYELIKKLKLDDLVEFKGFMKIENIINSLMNMHFFVQPSKTAKDGDME
jgi:colanic acid/amylovoran biosynthesis glycosyltransferase